MVKYLLSLLLVISCNSQEKKHSHNQKFLDPDMNPETWVERFENENRDVYKNRAQIVEQMNLKKAMDVADIGTGTGAFLSLISQKIGPTGTLYAQEISPKFIEYLKKRVKQEGLENVEVIKGSGKTTNLKADSVDLVFLCDVYHHFDHPNSMMNDIKKAMRENARLVIVEFDRDPKKSREWVLKHLDFNKEQLKARLQALGFHFVREASIPFEENYMLEFRLK